jgi:hypothetical protein
LEQGQLLSKYKDVVLMFSIPTWRATSDYLEKLGYPLEKLKEICDNGVKILKKVQS